MKKHSGPESASAEAADATTQDMHITDPTHAFRLTAACLRALGAYSSSEQVTPSKSLGLGLTLQVVPVGFDNLNGQFIVEVEPKKNPKENDAPIKRTALGGIYTILALREGQVIGERITYGEGPQLGADPETERDGVMTTAEVTAEVGRIMNKTLDLPYVGSPHRIDESLRALAEFEGSAPPAWPAQSPSV